MTSLYKKNYEIYHYDTRGCGRKKFFFRFCEKNFESDKVRDHLHLTDESRASAHNA